MKKGIWLCLATLAFSGIGCNAVMKRIGKDMGCDYEKVTTKRVSMLGTGFGPTTWAETYDIYSYDVEGCGRQQRFYIWCRSGVTFEDSPSQCGVSVSPEKRAAFELGCTPDQLKVELLDRVTVGIEGCGKRAVYVFEPFGRTWLMNTASQEK